MTPFHPLTRFLVGPCATSFPRSRNSASKLTFLSRVLTSSLPSYNLVQVPGGCSIHSPGGETRQSEISSPGMELPRGDGRQDWSWRREAGKRLSQPLFGVSCRIVFGTFWPVTQRLGTRGAC